MWRPGTQLYGPWEPAILTLGHFDKSYSNWTFFFLLSFQEPDDSQELEKMRDVVLGVSDKDNDGKLSRDELAMLLSDMNES